MPVNLTDELRRLSSEPPESRLADRLERVRACAERIWDHPRLEWFTDHTAQRHSARIIHLLGQALEHLQATPEALRRSELFILLAAAYLHDIGMQDFRHDGLAADHFTVADYELIRTRHPRRGRELIQQRSLRTHRDEFRIDLDDELQYLRPIALLAEGHGSAYFEAAVREIARMGPAPENMPIRGGALIALLLMADELDLHEDRARFPREMDVSPVAALHHHVNHYVTRVEICAGDLQRERRVRVYADLPPGSDEYKFALVAWIGEKLARQATRANSVLTRELNGELVWMLPVAFFLTTDATGTRRPLPRPAAVELEAEIAERAVIDRQDLLQRLKTALGEARVRNYLIEIGDSPSSDMAVVLSWLSARSAARGVPFASVSFLVATGHSARDVLQRLYVQLASHGVIFDRYAPADPAAPSVAEQTESFLGDLANHQRGVVVVIQDVDNADPETLRWLRAFGDGFAGEGARGLLVVTRSDNRRGGSPAFERFELGRFSTQQIAGYLKATLGVDEHTAALTATELFAYTGGEPANVHAGLAIRRQGLVECHTL